MNPIIIGEHEAVEWFKSKSHAEQSKRYWEYQGFDVLLHYETDHWDAWLVCIQMREKVKE